MNKTPKQIREYLQINPIVDETTAEAFIAWLFDGNTSEQYTQFEIPTNIVDQAEQDGKEAIFRYLVNGPRKLSPVVAFDTVEALKDISNPAQMMSDDAKHITPIPGLSFQKEDMK